MLVCECCWVVLLCYESVVGYSWTLITRKTWQYHWLRCVYICTCDYMLYMHVYACTHMHATHTHACMHIHTHKQAHTHACMHIHTCTHTAYTHTHAHTPHAHVHTHKHTHTVTLMVDNLIHKLSNFILAELFLFVKRILWGLASLWSVGK